MIVISCVDSGLRILSHEYLKKQYPQILQQMLQLTGNSKLWMNHTSAVLFDGMDANQVNVDEAFLNEAAPGEYCLVEEVDATPYLRWIEKVILFSVNADQDSSNQFVIPLDNWVLKESQGCENQYAVKEYTPK